MFYSLFFVLCEFIHSLTMLLVFQGESYPSSWKLSLSAWNYPWLSFQDTCKCKDAIKDGLYEISLLSFFTSGSVSDMILFLLFILHMSARVSSILPTVIFYNEKIDQIMLCRCIALLPYQKRRIKNLQTIPLDTVHKCIDEKRPEQINLPLLETSSSWVPPYYRFYSWQALV